MWLFAAAAAASLPLSLMFGSVAVDPVAALTGWLAPGDQSLPSAIVALRLPVGRLFIDARGVGERPFQ